MKKLLIFVVIVGALYVFKPDMFSFMNNKGAFDSEGKPVTLVFTHNKCGKACEETISLLKKRKIKFTEYSLDENAENQDLWKDYGRVNTFPNIIIGNDREFGAYKSRLVSILAINYGNSVLTEPERFYMKKHFYESGERKLVMYGASWCGYCKKLREELTVNNIDFVEIDVEKSTHGTSMKSVLDINGYPLVYYGYKRLEGPQPSDVLALF